MAESWRNFKLPLSPTRKFSPQQFFSATGRNAFGSLASRTSTPTPSSALRSSRNVLSPVSLKASPILSRIYQSKCKDLDIPENPAQAARFYKACEKFIKNRVFSITEQELGLHSAIAISDVLQNSSEFSKLILSMNHLQDPGCLKLASLICNNSSFIHLDISSNDLTSEGLKNFLDQCCESVSLVSLDVSSYKGLNRNRFGPAAAESLNVFVSSSRILMFLELNDTSLGDFGLEMLTVGLSRNKSLLKLGLAGNGISYKCIEPFFKVIFETSIEDLNFSNNKIADAGCKSLSDLLVFQDFSCKIKRLDVSKNDITFKGANGVFLAVRYNPTLKDLNFEANPLGSAAGQSLQFVLINNNTLLNLNLNSCKLKNDGIINLSQGLAANKALVYLNLANNEIKDTAAAQICEALMENEVLKHLDLSFNCIKDGVGFAEMLKKNTGLEVLSLKENKIKVASGKAFVEAARVKTNLLKFCVKGNHLAVKHAEEIEANVFRNKRLSNSGKNPEMLKKIEELLKGTSNLNVVYDEINRKKQEKLKALNKISQLQKKLSQIKSAQDARLQELKEESEAVKKINYLREVQLEQLLKEQSDVKLMTEKIQREHTDAIGNLVKETKQLEKNSKN